jgi:membrane-associated phospholipid phosphatase
VTPQAAGARLTGCWLLLLAGLLSVGWLLTHPLSRPVGGPENDLSRWVEDHRTPLLDHVAAVGTLLGDTVLGIVLLLVLGAGFSWWRRSRLPLLLVTVVYVGLLAAYLATTHLVPRDRPPVEILDKGLVPDHSFPSGHTMTSTAVVGCLLLLLHTYAPRHLRWARLLMVVPLLTMLSRIYQGAHHVSDVLAGLATAVVWLTVVARVLLRDRSR